LRRLRLQERRIGHASGDAIRVFRLSRGFHEAHLGESDMSKNRSGWVGTLVTVGALGAMAGMLAWRFSQRHRMQRQSFYRDLSRWEGEGGSVDEAAGSDGAGTEMAMAGGAAMHERDDAPRHGMKGSMVNGANGANGAAGTPWPFPHG
jgi:hypothetical protein